MKQTVSRAFRFEGDPVKGSRFIVDVAPVDTEALARDLVAAARADFADASHHCWACRLAVPAIERANDDGEPGGSAGRPILAALVGRDLIDTAIVVTRYFGGTKLGVGGLVRAYGGAAGQALDSVTLEPWVAMTEVRFSHHYAMTDAIDRAVTDARGFALARDFDAEVRQHIRLPLDALGDFRQAVEDMTAGSVIFADDPDPNP